MEEPLISYLNAKGNESVYSLQESIEINLVETILLLYRLRDMNAMGDVDYADACEIASCRRALKDIVELG